MRIVTILQLVSVSALQRGFYEPTKSWQILVSWPITDAGSDTATCKTLVSIPVLVLIPDIGMDTSIKYQQY